MNTKTWGAAERDEFHAACAEAWEEGEKQSERTAAFRDKVQDAVQAHRPWAYKVEDEAIHLGMASILKRWNKSHNQVLVSYDGRLLTKPRTLGAKRTDEDGVQFHQQALLDSMSWPELQAKREEFLRQALAYTQNVAMVDRLLALRDLAPASATPSDACRSLGTTVDAWLAEDAA